MHTATRSSLRSIAALLSVALFASQTPLIAQVPTQDAPPPAATASSVIPAQIASAHTVFLTNHGADANFPIDSTQAYNQVYAALQSWGRYRLVDQPTQADLIFQLRDIAPITDVSGVHGSVQSVTSPAFKLTIVDPATKVTLWTITSPVTLKGKKDVFAHWEAISVTNLVSRVKVVAGQPLSSQETAELTTYPNYHHGAAAAIIVGGTIAVGVGGGLLLHHEYENSLANQKAQQDAFCKANNIPLSECAGG